VRNLFVVAAVLGVLFGIGFLVVPDVVVGLYGGRLDETGALMARLYGKALISLGVISWLVRDAGDELAGRAVATGAVVNFTAGSILSAFAFVTGISNVLGLANAAAFAALAIAFVLLLTAGRRSDPRSPAV
jgi:hypothetical protein